MYYTARAEIQIGKVKIHGATQVEVNNSVDTIGGTAKITLPRNWMRSDGKTLLDQIATGDRVTVQLGYNDNMKTEFTGYLAHIGDTTPLVLECDDDWYTFKHADHITKSFKSVTLKDLLQNIFPGYTIDCIDFTFSGGYIIKDVTPYTVVKKIKDEVGFCAKLEADAKTISCFWPYDFQGFKKHTYVFGSRDGTQLKDLRDRRLAPNVAAVGLKFVSKDDRKLQITGKARQKNGTVITATVGSKDDDAEKRTMNFGSDVKTESELRQRIEAELRKSNYDGYEGTITGFGTPQTMPGDVLELIDPARPARNGSYLIKRVKVTFSQSGFRRENELSYRINA